MAATRRVALIVAAAIAIPNITAVASIEQRSSIADSVQTFCTDLADHNDAAAYGMPSHRERQAWPQGVFSDAVRSVHLSSCYVSSPDAQLVVSGNAASVQVTYVYSEASGGSASSDGTMALVNENGGWRVDTVDWINLCPAG